MPDNNLEQDFKDMKTEISVWKKVFSWALGVIGLVVIAAFCQSYVLADEYALLKYTVGNHEKIIPSNFKRIEKLTKDSNDMKIDIAKSQIRVEDLLLTSSQIIKILTERHVSITVPKHNSLKSRNEE